MLSHLLFCGRTALGGLLSVAHRGEADFVCYLLRLFLQITHIDLGLLLHTHTLAQLVVAFSAQYQLPCLGSDTFGSLSNFVDVAYQLGGL